MMTSAFHKIVVVTRKTALEELVERFNTREQAHFYLEHMGASFTLQVDRAGSRSTVCQSHRDRSRPARRSIALGASRGDVPRPGAHSVWPVILKPCARSAGVTTPVAKRRP